MKNKTQTLKEKFKAAYEAGEIERICAYQCPALGGSSARFYRNVSTLGGWLKATDSIDPANSETHTFEISEDRVELAEAIPFDRENTGSYSRTLLNLSDEIRGNATYWPGVDRLAAVKTKLREEREAITDFGEYIAFGTSAGRRFKFYRDLSGRFAATDDRPSYTQPEPETEFIFERHEPAEFLALAEACDVTRELMRKPCVAKAEAVAA